VIEEGATRGGQFGPPRTARQKLDADLQLQIADLPAKRGLRRVKPSIGCDREAAFFGHGNEIAKMPELHIAVPCLRGMGSSLQSLFQRHQTSPGVGRTGALGDITMIPRVSPAPPSRASDGSAAFEGDVR
jgi:hypothetical protein